MRQKVRVKSKLKNYYAPEKEKTFASDLWSLGILLVDLMKGRTEDSAEATQNSSEKKNSQITESETTLDETSNNKNLVSVSKEGRNVIAGLLRADPS